MTSLWVGGPNAFISLVVVGQSYSIVLFHSSYHCSSSWVFVYAWPILSRCSAATRMLHPSASRFFLRVVAPCRNGNCFEVEILKIKQESKQRDTALCIVLDFSSPISSSTPSLHVVVLFVPSACSSTPVIVFCNFSCFTICCQTTQVEPYYCMSWVLTWFGHDLQDLPTVSRLYDVLLGAHPTLILYICAAVSFLLCILFLFKFPRFLLF